MPKRDDAYMAVRRDEILDAANRCLARDGLPGFTTTVLCAEAGISVGALYRHFASRELVLIALAERESRERRAELDATSFDGFTRSIHGVLTVLESDEGRRRARLDLQVAALAAVTPSVSDALQPYLIVRGLELGLQQLQRTGQLAHDADPRALADALGTVMAGQVYMIALGATDGAQAARLVDAILAPWAPGG